MAFRRIHKTFTGEGMVRFARAITVVGLVVALAFPWGSVAPVVAAPMSPGASTPVAKAKPGYVMVRFTRTKGVPRAGQVVYLSQGKRTVVVRRPGPTRLPSSGVWRVRTRATTSDDGAVVDVLASRTTVNTRSTPSAAKRAAKGDGGVIVDYGNRTSVKAALVTSQDLTGPVTTSDVPPDAQGLSGWSVLSLPLESGQTAKTGEPIVIGRDVRGFPNGFVGKVLSIANGRATVEAVNPLTVFTAIRYSQTVPGSFAPVSRTRFVQGKDVVETDCSLGELRRLLDNTRPDFTLTFENDGISVERFGAQVGLTLNDDQTTTFSAALSGRCQVTLNAPAIRGPLGIQINLSAGGYIAATATGSVTFQRMNVSANQGWMVTGDAPANVGQEPVVTPPSSLGPDASLTLTLPGLAGHIGMQGPADIEVGSLEAGASVEVFLDPDFAINQIATPARDIPDCAVQRQSSSSGTVGIKGKAGIEAEFMGQTIGGTREWTPFSYTYSPDPFWVGCLSRTAPSTSVPTQSPDPAGTANGSGSGTGTGASATEPPASPTLLKPSVTTPNALASLFDSMEWSSAEKTLAKALVTLDAPMPTAPAWTVTGATRISKKGVVLFGSDKSGVLRLLPYFGGAPQTVQPEFTRAALGFDPREASYRAEWPTSQAIRGLIYAYRGSERIGAVGPASNSELPRPWWCPATNARCTGYLPGT